MPSSLANLIGAIESGNNPNASLTDYAGNVSVNAQYQQSAGWIAQYGEGASGIDNEANQLLARNPNATLGDFYSMYNHGSVLPWSTYSSTYSQQANNFLSNANARGYNQNTPLSSVVGTSAAGGSSVTMGGTDDQWNAQFLSASNQGVGADTPNLQDSDFDGLSDSDVWGGSSTVPGSITNTGGALQGTPNLGGGVSQTGTDAATPTNAGQSLGAGGGQPVNITDLPGLDTSVTGAGSAVQKGATTAGTDVETAAGGIAGTAASIFNNLQGYASGAVVVIALVILGLIFVAFGLGMFKHNLLPQVV